MPKSSSPASRQPSPARPSSQAAASPIPGRAASSRTNAPPTPQKTSSGRPSRGALIVLVGPAGYGKTSLAAQFPKPMDCIFDQFDQGLTDLVSYDRVDGDGITLPDPDDIITHDPDGWKTLMRRLNQFCTLYRDMSPEERPKTLLMENMKGFETACFRYVCAHEYGDSWEKFMTYSNGPKTAASTEWPRLMECVNIIRSYDVHVLMTGHTTVSEKKSAEYDHPVSLATATAYIFDATIKDANLVMQIGLDYEVVRKGKGDYQTTRASKDAKTKLICNKSPIYGSCKNHFGIESEIILTGSPADSYKLLCKEAKLNPATFKPYPR